MAFLASLVTGQSPGAAENTANAAAANSANQAANQGPLNAALAANTAQQNLAGQIAGGTGAGAGGANALAQQQAFTQAATGQNGLGNQSALYGQLGNIAAGQGPNPAQAMLAQQTGQNVAQQGALMAGQRGSGANVGLESRQIAQQGAATQQQAVGQGATMQAQQSLAALGQQQALAGQQVAQQQAALGQQITGQQGQQALANQATTQAAQQASNLYGTQGGVLNAGQQTAQQAANVGTQANAQLASGAISGGLRALGSAASGGATALAAAAQGGWVPGYAAGGSVEANNPKLQQSHVDPRAPMSMLHKHTQSHIAGKFAKGGQVPALVSPGERYLPPKEVKAVAEGKKEAIKAGEKIPGKPKVGGNKNSYKNDTVEKTLKSGGMVLPRSVTQSADPAKSAAAFVKAHLAKRGSL